ncbi:MAG: hypothetical protein LBI12_03310 [Treponema sp.]|nr:hypothetical protein [Treponema sp.]
MKKLAAFLAFSLFSSSLWAQQNLVWSMALVKNNESISFSRRVEMTNNDRFDIIIRTNQSCYAYIIIQDDERMEIINRQLDTNETWTIGPVIITPPSGSETFHVVISLNEQIELKNAINAYNNRQNTRTTRALNNAVARARREASLLSENPEKPIGMGGVFRGKEINGTEFSGSNIYVKTVVIHH